MSKGKKLLNDFIGKVIVSLKQPTWETLTAGWTARQKLESYLDPPRNKNGHFASNKTATPKQEEQL